jgi:hypothetical protein
VLRRTIGSVGGALGGALVALVALVAGCSDDGPGDAERFCGEVREHIPELVTPPATADDIDDFLGLYRRIGDVAPLAIEPHWQALVLNYETASTVETADPASVQRATRQAYATERSAVEVKDWLVTNCGVDLGPVSTIVGPAPAPATTVPAG